MSKLNREQANQVAEHIAGIVAIGTSLTEGGDPQGGLDDEDKKLLGGVVGVGQKLKDAKPVPPLVSQEEANRIITAVRTAATTGKHAQLTEIVKLVTSAVGAVKGLIV